MKRAVLTASLALELAASGTARADTSTDVGLFTAVVGGTHVGFGNPVPTSGVVPGAALEVTERVDRVRLHLEGIPTVAASGSGSGPFGRSSASLTLVNATALVDLDARHVVRVGAGYQLIDLTNKNGNNGDRNDVRIASPIYAVAADVPLRRNRFIESQVLLEPNLRGPLLVFGYTGVSRPSEPEVGAEVDYAAAYGWNTRRFSYLAGVRGLSYHTRNASSSALVDRNTGIGVTFEARYHVTAR